MVVEQACPAFVPLIEAGDCSSDELRQVARTYLAPLLAASVETIVLGCTHYPLLIPLLKQLLPDSIQLIDPALGVARQLDAVLGVPAAAAGDTLELGQCQFCVTADPEGFANRATPGWGPVLRSICSCCSAEAITTRDRGAEGFHDHRHRAAATGRNRSRNVARRSAQPHRRLVIPSSRQLPSTCSALVASACVPALFCFSHGLWPKTVS